jgi:hypothetical protein
MEKLEFAFHQLQFRLSFQLVLYDSMNLTRLVRDEKLFDYRYQSKHLMMMLDDDNNHVLVVLLHVFLDQLFSHVLRFHDRRFHRQNQIEKFVVENVVFYGSFHFLYSIKNRRFKIQSNFETY